jgi:hypothetical protein
MILLSRWNAFVVATGSLFCLAACHHPKDTGPQYIMLTFNAGACEQNGLSDVIDVDQSRAVIYQGASLVSQFEVRFHACPFTSCPISSPYGMSVNIGQPKSDAIGTIFNYTAMSINGDECKNAGSLGIHVIPGS